MYDFHIILGCYGNIIENFVCCPGISNIILSVNTSILDYNNIMNHIDMYLLFDNPLLDINGIRHFIYDLNNRFNHLKKPLWSPNKFQLYDKFIIDHKQCGVFIELKLPDSVHINKEQIILKNKFHYGDI